ncbi:alpha-N-acetylgalactosaminide alpha-2,6-sialyltransferase 2 isoform X2 [Mugil cephalus]|uniref:alpha-N-acetylgalactosaminide alpha-2,6-sialyltransferase 2 isoform X2 n=1 Tax=Mugil cephalus TaxID=48193 RepID=UPI001FB62722|nr:alpha-N-acetylgalactosaminide alpha-2,6-sialyltransferase 2 isoform X2 [Mugil cephalus]
MMTAMALSRRLQVGALAVALVLGAYVLCLSAEWRPSCFDQPLGCFHGLVPSISSPPPRKVTSRQRDQPPPTSPPTSPPPPERLPQPQFLKTQATSTVKPPHLPLNGSSSDADAAAAGEAPPPTTAATPTEPPFIGDAYMSEDVAPQTTCPAGVRGRLRASEFGGRVLERVPVLQAAKHATPEQYQRLSRYPGTHGWGGVDYKTLLDTLSVLNSSANWQMLDDWTRRGNGSECSRCAVVGNGGILKDSGKGPEIDGHHYVFRTNGAILKGFEQDVGARTTHYTFSTNTLMNSLRSYAGAGYRGPPVSEETRYVFLPDHDRDYLLMKAAATRTAVERGPERYKDPLKYFGEDVSAEKLKMYHPDFIRYLRNRFLRSHALNTKYKDIYRPSTGAVMLLAALHTCDQVSAYGFMTPDYKNYSDHYYDSSYRPVGFFINHDLRMEMNLWQQLNQAGLIRLYTRH